VLELILISLPLLEMTLIGVTVTTDFVAQPIMNAMKIATAQGMQNAMVSTALVQATIYVKTSALFNLIAMTSTAMNYLGTNAGVMGACASLRKNQRNAIVSQIVWTLENAPQISHVTVSITTVPNLGGYSTTMKT